MRLGEYQERARDTDQNPPGIEDTCGAPDRRKVIPLLGLVGEVGSLLSEYKKLLRDGEIHRSFQEEVAEELGDILWYVANVADKFGLDLEEVAATNLTKVKDRWLPPPKRRLYDEGLAPNQQLPRTFEFRFEQQWEDGAVRVRMVDVEGGTQTGDPLRDNSYEDDGYRFHDAIHLAFAAYLGWSPVLRKLLRNGGRMVHRTPANVDDAEDGGRGRVVEEAIVATAYIYAEDHAFLEGARAIDHKLLQHIMRMTRNLEVSDRSAWEWNQALLSGFEVWRQLRACGGGRVVGDLERRSLEFKTDADSVG